MPATDWSTLLQHLATTPRENGSAALDTTANYLADTLRSLGWQTELSPFTAYPYEHRAFGIVLLIGSALYWWAMRARRFGAASIVAIVLPILVWVHFDHGLPFSFGIGAVTEQNVVARLPVDRPQHRLLFSAHYDTKTDLADHILRAPVQFSALPMIILMIAIALSSSSAVRASRFTKQRQRVAAGIAWLALLYGVANFGVFTGGAFVPARSPGAIDDGAACAVLIRLAETLAAQRPPNTEVELVFFAAEELAAQGSASFAAQRFSDPARPKPLVINLDPLGASTDLAVVGKDSTFLKRFDPAAEVVAVLDAVHRKLTGRPIPLTPIGGLTDAFPFLDHNVPAATVLNTVPPFLLPRKLHSAADTSDRIVPGALDYNLRFLIEVVRSVDAGLPAPN